MVLLPLLSNPRHGLKNSVIGGCHGMDAFLKKRFFLSTWKLAFFLHDFLWLDDFCTYLYTISQDPPKKNSAVSGHDIAAASAN